jgi:hypothetical protein
MALQSVDHPGQAPVHRPMSLLLQALKQIELKAPVTAAAQPQNDVPLGTKPVTDVDIEPAAGTHVRLDAAIASNIADVTVQQSLSNAVQGCQTIELIRQYEASETKIEIAAAGRADFVAVPVLTAPVERKSTTVSYGEQRRRRFTDDVLKLLPSAGQSVIALAAVAGLEASPAVRELCLGLSALGDGKVLQIARLPRPKAGGNVRPCLSDLVIAHDTFQEAVYTDPMTGLCTIDRGDDEAFATAGGRMLSKLWHVLNERFSFIVVDAGPTESPSMGSLLASSDGTFAVVKLNRTLRHDAERLVARIRAVGGRPCGCLVID